VICGRIGITGKDYTEDSLSCIGSARLKLLMRKWRYGADRRPGDGDGEMSDRLVYNEAGGYFIVEVVETDVSKQWVGFTVRMVAEVIPFNRDKSPSIGETWECGFARATPYYGPCLWREWPSHLPKSELQRLMVPGSRLDADPGGVEGGE
jgi:hypothetical protein